MLYSPMYPLSVSYKGYKRIKKNRMGKFNNQRAAIKLMPNNDLEITGTAQNIQDLIKNNKSQFYRGEFYGMDILVHYPEKMNEEDVYVTHFFDLLKYLINPYFA